MRYDHESGFTVIIEDSSQVGEARRAAGAIAAAAELNATDAGRFAILVTEAASNIAKHATRGEVMLRSIRTPGLRGAELVAIDAGPGIPDLDRAQRDGYSTAGSPGAGLGTFSRLATHFDIYTVAGAGTVVLARIEVQNRGPAARRAFDVGIVRAPKRGESECGDDWSMVVDENGRALVAVADGLGHGIAAAEAARRAVQVATEHSAESAGAVVAAIHGALRSTRGAALGVAELSSDRPEVRFAGLGNIAGSIVTPTTSKSLVSHNGIAGHEMRKIQEFPYDWPPDALLILHSDGISGRWDLSRYPGLHRHDPSVVAGVIYRDFSRGRDDALVVVVRTTVEARVS
jgi:anti-sigma regulatory factor (Ser/Thr protein kinase)